MGRQFRCRLPVARDPQYALAYAGLGDAYSLLPAYGGDAPRESFPKAEAAAKLHHTNIVPIYATGEQDGIHFYAMELIDGPSLDAVIRQFRDQSKLAERNLLQEVEPTT